MTKKDFRIDTFRAGGNGGQKQNKTSSGVRVTHVASGAVGEARDSRSQLQNKSAAFLRCVKSARFQTWFRFEQAIRSGQYVRVNRMLAEDNLKIEGRKNGEWVEL